MHAYRKVRSRRPDSEGGMPLTSWLPLNFLQHSAAQQVQHCKTTERTGKFHLKGAYLRIIFSSGAASVEEQGYWNNHTF